MILVFKSCLMTRIYFILGLMVINPEILFSALLQTKESILLEKPIQKSHPFISSKQTNPPIIEDKTRVQTLPQPSQESNLKTSDQDLNPDPDDDIWSLFNQKTENIKTNYALFRGFNKIDARPHDFILEQDRQYQFGPLFIVLKHCEKTPPEEIPENYAFIEVYQKRTDLLKKNFSKPKTIEEKIEEKIEGKTEEKEAQKIMRSNNTKLSDEINASIKENSVELSDRQELKKQTSIAQTNLEKDKILFSGWMFASNPALSSIEHPVYDFWLIGCKTSLEVKEGSQNKEKSTDMIMP